MNRMSIKNSLLLLFFFCITPLFSTMGDNTMAQGKKVNFYGKLETYSVQTKRVEQITFWNRQLKAQLYQAPETVIDMIKSGLSNSKQGKQEEFILLENPLTTGIVATVELREIQSISVPMQKKIIYKENDKISQEFIAIEITLHGGTGMYYLAEKGDKLYCQEQSGTETVELEVPLTSVKRLTVEGFVSTEQTGS